MPSRGRLDFKNFTPPAPRSQETKWLVALGSLLLCLVGLLALCQPLKKEAAAAGGAVITLLGNHEVLNAMGISVYASPRSATAFGDDGERASAFRAGSELATELSSWPVACVVGDTAFIHGGLTLAQVSGGLGDLNAASSDWLKGRRALTAQIGSSTPDLWLEAPASTWSQP